MTIAITHAKTNTITDWTQAELDEQIALGNYPPGTLLADIVLPSDWNAGLTTSMDTGKLLGRSTASVGAFEEITVGSGLTLVAGTLTATGGGTGDVVGPASATDNAIARFDTTTGKLIQNSAATIADTSGNITAGTYNGNTIGAGSTSGTNTGDQTSVSGNAGTATALATGRTIAITGDLAYTSPSFDGTANVTAAGTLATVNANVGSFTNANITVNAKGLITAASDGSAGGTPVDITVANEATDTTCFPAFFTAATGNLGPKTNAGLAFNSSTSILTATGFSGPLTGNVTGNVSGTAATVTTAAQPAITSLGTLTTLTVDDITINGNTISSAGASTLAITPTAGQAITFDGTVTLDAGVIAGATSISSTSFTGALTGNASTATALQNARTIGGVSFDGSANIVPQTIQSVNEAADTTCFPLFISASGSQSLQPLNSTSLTYNAATGALGATTLGGTLTTAAQTNITSVGTLTGGATGAGFTVALGSSTITGQLALANGGTGANLTDPNADRILFWDDSAGSTAFLTPGNALTITTTTIAVDSASDTVDGVVELATIAETTTGTDATRAVTPDGLAGSDYGKRIVGVLVSDPQGSAISTGDGKACFRIPSALNAYNLIAVAASVSTVSSSGIPTVQLRRSRRATATSRTDADMLSTKLTIDASEFDSIDAAAAAVIDAANDDVQTGDNIYIDIDVAGTDAKGLFCELTFQLP